MICSVVYFDRFIPTSQKPVQWAGCHVKAGRVFGEDVKEAANAVENALDIKVRKNPDERGPVSYEVLEVPGSSTVLVRRFGHSLRFGYATQLAQTWTWRKGGGPRLVASGEDDLTCPSGYFGYGSVVDTEQLRASFPVPLSLQAMDYLTVRLRLGHLISKGLPFWDWPRMIIDLNDTAKVEQVLSKPVVQQVNELLKPRLSAHENRDRCMLLWGRMGGEYFFGAVVCFQAITSDPSSWSRPVTTSLEIHGDGKIRMCEEQFRLRSVPLDAPATKP